MVCGCTLKSANVDVMNVLNDRIIERPHDMPPSKSVNAFSYKKPDTMHAA